MDVRMRNAQPRLTTLAAMHVKAVASLRENARPSRRPARAEVLRLITTVMVLLLVQNAAVQRTLIMHVTQHALVAAILAESARLPV
jgi:hypothetical protein